MLVFTSVKKEMSPLVATKSTPKDPAALITAKGFFDILKYLYTPEEAQIAIHLSALPESVKRIHKRLQKNNIRIEKDKLGEILEDLFQRGIILSYRHINSQSTKKKYGLVHFAIGFYDFQIDRIDRKFAEISDKYHQREYYKGL